MESTTPTPLRPSPRSLHAPWFSVLPRRAGKAGGGQAGAAAPVDRLQWEGADRPFEGDFDCVVRKLGGDHAFGRATSASPLHQGFKEVVVGLVRALRRSIVP